MNRLLEQKIDNLIERLQQTPDVGILQAGSEYRIVNRNTGETLETCYTAEYANRALEKIRMSHSDTSGNHENPDSIEAL